LNVDKQKQPQPQLLSAEHNETRNGGKSILEHVWEKPVIVFYKERYEKPEVEAFVVVKAREIAVSSTKGKKFNGRIKDFFPLMGNIDYISTAKGKTDGYVLCWFDDKEEDFNKFWRQATTVTFPKGITFTVDKKGKRTYSATFEAEHAKLK
jgi:hypothetical protein